MSRSPSTVAVIMAKGCLDSVEARPLRATLHDHLSQGTSRIIVDLSAVTFMDSAGLASLVIGMERARLDGGDVRLVSPTHPVVRSVLDRTRFDEVFSIADDLDRAHLGW